MELKENTKMKIVIIDYANHKINIISNNSIDFDCLENEHNWDENSYLIENHNFDNSNSDFMVCEDLTIDIN
jgi:hypothetical protein